MYIFRHIAIRLSMLCALLVALNWFYDRVVFSFDKRASCYILDSVSDLTNVQTLYFGDCSDTYFGHEKDAEGISKRLNRLTVNGEVRSVSGSAQHAGVFLSVLKNVSDKNDIHTIIVSLNLRSFSQRIQYNYFENDINKKLCLLSDRPPLLNRILLSFNGYVNHQSSEWDKLKANRWKRDKVHYSSTANTLWEAEQEYIMQHTNFLQEADSVVHKGVMCIRNYCFEIDTISSIRIQNLDDIVSFCEEKEWKLIFNFLPEDLSKVRNYVGDNLMLLINKNHDLLMDRYHRNGVVVVDNMELLHPTEFIEIHPNSHYTSEGRAKIVSSLLPYIN